MTLHPSRADGMIFPQLFLTEAGDSTDICHLPPYCFLGLTRRIWSWEWCWGTPFKPDPCISALWGIPCGHVHRTPMRDVGPHRISLWGRSLLCWPPGSYLARKLVLHSHARLQLNLSLIPIIRRCYVSGTPWYFRKFMPVWIHSCWLY